MKAGGQRSIRSSDIGHIFFGTENPEIGRRDENEEKSMHKKEA